MYKNKDKLLVTKKRLSNAAFVRPFFVNIYDFWFDLSSYHKFVFPFNGICSAFSSPAALDDNQEPCKGEQIRPGSEVKRHNEHNFTGPHSRRD